MYNLFWFSLDIFNKLCPVFRNGSENLNIEIINKNYALDFKITTLKFSMTMLQIGTKW